MKEKVTTEKEYVDAVSKAVDYCVEHGILADFFSSRKAEVIKNMTIDMTYERRLELTAKEYMEQGIQQGIEQGIERGEQIKLIDMVIKKISKNKALNVIADELEEDIETIRPIYDVVLANQGKSAEEIYYILNADSQE